ncbi:hypothetical protein VNO78_20238 [Psophocarpus tetragonolobus]|uniref:Uncharacterized protein n=1 Tax=Psophocarpus tetragonolobus TaxID=3891 RepID=A0AAN9S9Y6_PSOTE
MTTVVKVSWIQSAWFMTTLPPTHYCIVQWDGPNWRIQWSVVEMGNGVEVNRIILFAWRDWCRTETKPPKEESHLREPPWCDKPRCPRKPATE